MSNLQSTIEQYDARLQELEVIRKAEHASWQLIQAERVKVEKRKQAIVRRVFLDLAHDKEAFNTRCFAEMGVAREGFPTCFCRHHDINKWSLDEKFRSLYMGMGIETKNVVFTTHSGRANEPICDLISRQRGCYTIDDCLGAFREHLQQLHKSELEPGLSTIEECAARLNELERLDHAHYTEMRPIWDEESKIKSKKKEVRRLSFVIIVNDRWAFKQRCLEEMGMSEADCPPCLCSYQDNAKNVLKKFVDFCNEQLGIGPVNLLFTPHRNHPKEPIYKLIEDGRGCYTIDNCLEALREHMKLLLMSDSERKAARENEKRLRNATDERIVAMTEVEFVAFYHLIEREGYHSHEHSRGREIRSISVYDKLTNFIVYLHVYRMPDDSLLGWEHAHRPVPF